MANYPQELAQDAVCQSHTCHMTGLWFLPTRPLRLNTNEWMSNTHTDNYYRSFPSEISRPRALYWCDLCRKVLGVLQYRLLYLCINVCLRNAIYRWNVKEDSCLWVTYIVSVCWCIQTNSSYMTGLWSLPTRPLRLNTNEWMNLCENPANLKMEITRSSERHVNL